jgi:hypothetical protein
MQLYNSIGPNPRVGRPLDPGLKPIGAWYERMKARPSAAA